MLGQKSSIFYFPIQVWSNGHLLWHFPSKHIHGAPQAFCLFSTMHCATQPLNPWVKIEFMFPAAITSTLSSQRPVTHPNYPSPPWAWPITLRTLLKENGRVVQVGSDLVKGMHACTWVCVCVCVVTCWQEIRNITHAKKGSRQRLAGGACMNHRRHRHRAASGEWFKSWLEQSIF